MSFFGFDSTLPKDGTHNTAAPGFGLPPDPFAGLSGRNEDDDDNDDDALDFEETYDGLGGQLDETDDVLNTDTFGDSAVGTGQRLVGRDFDFFGQTANMTNTMAEEQMLHASRQPVPRLSPPKIALKPARTGYERYVEPGYIPQLEANASIWGMQRQGSPAEVQQRGLQSSSTGPSRKMMSLEEVEAAMQTQNRKTAASGYQQPPLQQSGPSGFRMNSTLADRPVQQQFPAHQPLSSQTSQQLSDHNNLNTSAKQQSELSPPEDMLGAPQILQRQHSAQAAPSVPVALNNQLNVGQVPARPRQPLHTTSRGLQPNPSSSAERPRQIQGGPMHQRGPSLHGRPFTHPQQMMHLSEEERIAFLEEEAKRAKRNHKIFLLSRDNGLMTPQDKNFITRVQLQQLVTATGGVDEQSPEAALAEDFYYQVYSQIRGASRQNPNQPLSHFAQTYLYQTAGRGRNRRYPIGGESHMKRMEQQVQRAVEAAKMKPKNKQLVIEGSLGKISFSNAKTPKPLLNLRRHDSSDTRPQNAGRIRVPESVAGLKAVLRDIETLYTTLLKMEDHERRMPPPPKEESSTADEMQEHMEWRQTIQELNSQLWSELKVLEPIIPNSLTPHPFIAILSHPKGKKLIPRVFRQLDEQQRLTILTMIVVHLDMLDVVRLAYLQHDETQLPKSVRDEIELFSHALMPSLFSYVNDAALGIVIGLVGLVVDRINMRAIIRTKIGLGLLTMFISRAELIKQGANVDDADLDQWNILYNQLFDVLEPQLAFIFPGPINTGDATYVWQFLAAVGIGASPEQQQRLVIAVKDSVMETVLHAKTLPDEIANARLGIVNLFMRAIGLDVDLLG